MTTGHCLLTPDGSGVSMPVDVAMATKQQHLLHSASVLWRKPIRIRQLKARSSRSVRCDGS